MKNKFPFTRRSEYRFGFTIGVILTCAIIGAGVFIWNRAQILFKGFYSWGLGFALQTEVWIADIQEKTFTETNFCFFGTRPF
jgi:uncharacterized membrane protein YwaF